MLPYYLPSIDYSMDPSSIELKKFLALTEYSVPEDVSSADSQRSPLSSSSPHLSPMGLESLSTSTSATSSSFGSPLSPQQTLDYDFCEGKSNRNRALLLANRKLSLDIEHQRNIDMRHDMVFYDVETPLFPNNLTVPLHFISHELHDHQPIRAKRGLVLFQSETFLSPNNSSRESSPLFGHSDSEDADGESEDSDADDDYVPPTEITTSHKRRRAAGPSPRRKPSHSPSSSSFSHPASKRTRPLPGSRVRHSPPSRNKQASSVETIQRAVEDTTAASTGFICPECGWQQVNRRMPDFKRHLKTHTRPSESDQAKGWWCKGILLEHTTDYHVSASSQPYDFLGRQRVGGCLRTFSRRDALKRHLDNSNTTCIGRPCEATED
ncbi:hypothetical protein BDQ12DRAFT_733875 [Crucibulum laeve]|uniref:C2H2-type domain-containing protein n=1 Tax=Crucibulum laeve TaxID=68775 RepID=A0A5C3M5H9_9AGAR|nr:hypothetical protein BDQ12DRAFT_733875 [Crucibulum laeve]